MHNSGSCLCKVPVQLFINFYFFLFCFLTYRLDWHAYINCSAFLALLWLHVLMRTLFLETHPAPCQLYGMYRFSSWNIIQELGLNWQQIHLLSETFLKCHSFIQQIFTEHLLGSRLVLVCEYGHDESISQLPRVPACVVGAVQRRRQWQALH